MRVQEFTTIKQHKQEAIDWLNRTGNHLRHSTINPINYKLNTQVKDFGKKL